MQNITTEQKWRRMRTFSAKLLRNHWHVLLIVPLVVIVMTWPTLPKIFNGDEIWFHNRSSDVFMRIWDAWHIGRVLAGQAELWRTTDMFHPGGASLVFQSFSFPHALLMLALVKLMPADSAENLLFLLILCFNGISAYALVAHFLRDKWAALFGALVTVLGIPFALGNSVPDIICIGTMPLALLCLHRALDEDRRLYAALAGVCAGITAFISMYIFSMILLSAVALAAFRLPSRWRQRPYWRQLLVFGLLCAAIAGLRIAPMIADRSALQAGLAKYEGSQPSADLLTNFVNMGNPVTRDLLLSVINVPPDQHKPYRTGYVGYINLFFLACALLRIKRGERGRLLPWAALLVFFAVLRLGSFLTVNGVAYRDVILPLHVLKERLPLLFDQIGGRYYLIALVTPLSLLSSFGLAALIRGRAAKTRALAALFAILILMFEFYSPVSGLLAPKGATAYMDWLKTESDENIKLISLPYKGHIQSFSLYAQSLNYYPIATGIQWRILSNLNDYLDRNLLLSRWRKKQNTHCIRDEIAYNEALRELASDGFTHVVFHRWTFHRWSESDLLIEPSFRYIPAAYDDGLVTVYRLRDLRPYCLPRPEELPRFRHLAASPYANPGEASAVVSFHPSQSFDVNTLAYLGALFSDWDSFHHLYRYNGAWVTQSAGLYAADGEDSLRARRIVHLVYDTSEPPPRLPASIEFRDEFSLCQRETHDDGAVIEVYFNRQFSCALVNSDSSLRVEYDNGAEIANLLYDFKQDILDLQILWRNSPDKTHSLSVQLFDAAGEKAHGQDFVIGSRSITHHIVDLSALPPGDYVVKLIFYRYSTGKSVPGTVSGSGVRFDRELELATIRKS